MAKYAIVEGGTVTNIIEWDGSAFHPDSSSWILCNDTAQIGATYNGSAFAYTAPEPTAEQVQAAVDKTSGHNKLVALGLTDDEIAALGIR